MTVNIRGKEIECVDREVWHAAAAGKWEPETFDVLDKYIVPGKEFIDIGAWVGVLSFYAEKLGAEVHAIEPDPKAFEELDDNKTLNKSSVFIYELAISDTDDDLVLNTTAVKGFGNSESSLIQRNEIKEAVEVASCTLESFIYFIDRDNICLIKMDIEGAEVMVLKQAKDFLKQHKPTMYISFHPGYFVNREDDIQMIIDIMFSVYDCGKTEDEFRQILQTDNAFHSFLFKAK